MNASIIFFINNGLLEIVGAVNFTDGLTLSATGVLGIDLDKLVDFDSIIVGGDLAFDGSLDVSVVGFH